MDSDTYKLKIIGINIQAYPRKDSQQKANLLKKTLYQTDPDLAIILETGTLLENDIKGLNDQLKLGLYNKPNPDSNN